MAARHVSVCCSVKPRRNERTRQASHERTNGVEPRLRPKPPNRTTLHTTRTEPEFDPSERDNDVALQQKLAKATQIELYLTQSINQYSARDALQRIETVLHHSELLQHREVVYLARLTGLILIRSPLNPTDATLSAVVNQISATLETRLPDLTISELCDVIGSYGCLGPHAMMPSFYKGVKKLVMQICMRLEGESVRSVPDAVRLFSGLAGLKLSHHTGVTFQTLRRLVPMLRQHDFVASDLAKLVLLVGKLKVYDGNIFLRTAARAMKARFHECTDEALCDFVKGFAIYDLKMMPGVFDDLTMEAKRRLPSMKISLLIDLTESLSRIQYLPDEGYLQHVCQRIVAAPSHLTSKDVATCSVALAHLDYHSPELLEVLKMKFCQLKSAMCIKEVCWVLLGFARLGALTEELLNEGLQAMKRELPHRIKKAQKLSIHQILTHAELFLKMDVADSDLFPKKWQDACRNEWIRDQKRPLSKTEASIQSTAKLMGIDIHQESSQIGDLWIHTLASPDGQRQLVFDLVLPKQYCYLNQRDKILPWKQWQYRVLEAQGFEILSLVEEEWLQVPVVSRMRHLASKMNFWSLEEIMAMEEATGVRLGRECVE